jgi:formylglycine-generating enzyme required for sulfatase activity
MSKRSQTILISYITLVLLFGVQLYSDAQNISYAPTISSIKINQTLLTGSIEITFDVDDPDGGLLDIQMLVSKDNGQTYTVSPQSATGDVNKYIIAGKGKSIKWDMGKDLPGIDSNNIKIRLIADDGIKLLPDTGTTTSSSSSTSTTTVSEVSKTKAVKDVSKMILIPAGEFEMGSSVGDADERPVHTVNVGAFYIDMYEVTNAQYKEFVDATSHESPVYWKYSNFNESDQPVVGITWDDANAYAKWAGKRLPTEAEWEKAARGGLMGKKYAWGDSSTPPSRAGNFADETAKKVFKKWDVINGYDDGFSHPAPVGCFDSNGYGVCDMMGNVWEWCSDWYDSGYYSKSSKDNPKGPSTGQEHVIRGGSWFSDKDYLRVSNRYNYNPSYTMKEAANIGFRCAKDAK